MAARGRVGRITVAAGTNGAGKSTIVAPFLRAAGGAYYNPDEYTKSLVAAGVGLERANAMAWSRGFDALRAAIDANADFTFETTLGGQSVTGELLRALALGREVVILYVGLESPELHVRRVAERVGRGGHDIPESKIRERYIASRENLLKFIGTRATIRAWDNSAQSEDGRPLARLVVDIRGRKIRYPGRSQLVNVPQWAKAIVAKALRFG